MSEIQSADSYVTGRVMNIQYNVSNIGAGEPYENYWQDIVVSINIIYGNLNHSAAIYFR